MARFIYDNPEYWGGWGLLGKPVPKNNNNNKKEIKEVKAIEVSYKRVISTENYSNVEIGIKLTVEDGEKAQDVLEKAKEFVDRQLDIKKEGYSYKVEEYTKILMNPDNYQYREVIDAQKFMKEYEEKQKQLEDEIPPF